MKAGLDEEFDVDGESVVKHVLASVGEQPSSARHGPVERGASSGGSHLGEVSIELQGGDVRPIAAREVARRWREATPPIPDVEELTFRSALFSAGDPIDIQLRSSDVELLRQASERLKEHLAEYPGVFDVADSFRDGKQEIKLSILPAAETLGLTSRRPGRPGAARLLRRRGPAHPARPRRRAGDGALPGEPAALAGRPRRAAHPHASGRRGALLRRGARRARPRLRHHQAQRPPARHQRHRRRGRHARQRQPDPGGAAGGVHPELCWSTSRA